MTLRRRSLVGLALLALVAPACGSEGGPVEAEPSETDSTDEPTVVQETGSVAFEPGTQLPPLTEGPDPAVGQPSPFVEGERFDGSIITIGGDTGQPALYVFLAHWCPHCNDEIPELIELNDSGRLPDNLDVVAISTGAASDRDNYPPSEWLVEKDWPWDAMADDENLTAIQVFGGNSFPFTVLVDADGTVLARRAGSATADQIADWLAANLSSA